MLDLRDMPNWLFNTVMFIYTTAAIIVVISIILAITLFAEKFPGLWIAAIYVATGFFSAAVFFNK